MSLCTSANIHTNYYFRNEGEDKKEIKPSSDLLDLDFGHPQINSQQPPPPTRTAASGSVQLDPWGTPKQQINAVANNDPWGGSANAMATGTTTGDSPYNNARIPNSDPWSPVQQNLATAATGAIPRTSPAVGLDNGSKGPDLQRNPLGK